VARTLVDLADVVSERRLGDAVNEAQVRRLFDLGSVEATLARLPGAGDGIACGASSPLTAPTRASPAAVPSASSSAFAPTTPCRGRAPASRRVTWPDLQLPARLAAELKAIRSERL
jgi:hypothetical protein